MMTLPANLQTWDRASRTREAHDLLVAHYGRPEWDEGAATREPLVERLIRVVVAQNTSRANRALALDRLYQRFPDPALLADAPLYEIIDAIYPAGLANTKAPRLQEMVQQLLEATEGTLDLSFLRTMPVDEALRFLTTLPGIGNLSARLVMLFGLGRPVLPVNTGLLRVARRVGMVAPGTSADRAHDLLPRMLPDEALYAFHVNMARHARETCTASRPDCAHCPLAAICLWVHGGEALGEPAP
mgnify:CR=1 FL=1